MSTPKRMNYIFILADDLGYMDVALNGSTYYETPNLQRLARKGVTFTNAYAHPLCSPTRSALLTGQYPHRTMVNAPGCHLPDNRENFRVDQANTPAWAEYETKNSLTALPTGLYTIGEAFRDNGYRTGLIGKHHLGRPNECQMKYRGFDVDLGMPVPGPGSYYRPYFAHFRYNGNTTDSTDNPWDNGDLVRDDEHLSNRLAREAVRFIDESMHFEKPFFLELWDFSIHAPFEAKKEYVEYFRKKHVPYSHQDGHFQMACMLKVMDDTIGTVLDCLERNGIADNTAVIFMGDNGGNMYDGIFGDFPTDNYPLRQGKGTIYEGGIRVPCTACIPGVTPEGAVVHENIHAVDFYPTFMELAHLKIDPARFENANLDCPDVPDRRQVLDGLSLVPLLSGQADHLDRPGVFTNFIANVPAPGNMSSAAINSGDWKLIINYETNGGIHPPYELFNLKENITETVNLADRYPEKVAELKALIEAHQASIPQAQPHKNPRFDPNAPTPQAFRNWEKWFEHFKAVTAEDPTIASYPRVVTEDETTAYYEKVRPLLILKLGYRVCMDHGHDRHIDREPQLREGALFLPAALFGCADKGPYVPAADLELPVRLAGDLVLVGEGPNLSESDLERTDRYLLSYALSDAVQWRPTPTTPFAQKETVGFDHLPKGKSYE